LRSSPSASERSPLKEERREADYYPTPPCAGVALRHWCVGRGMLDAFSGVVCDPAAGAGALFKWLDVPHADRRAIELREDAALHLADSVPHEHITIGDALTTPWPAGTTTLVMNPPFNALDAFLSRCAELWPTLPDLRYTFILTPTQWWQASSRLKYPRPDHILMLTWRAPFMGKGAAPWDTMWCVYEHQRVTQQSTTAWWLPYPITKRHARDRDPRWDEFERMQPAIP